MKNIKEITRGNDSVSLEFKDKNSTGTLTYSDNSFAFSPSLTVVEGTTDEELAEVVRKTLTPYEYVSYLPVDEEYTTDTLTTDTPTKVLIPTTIKVSNAWELTDLGDSDYALTFTGAAEQDFKIFMSSSTTTSANNTTITVYMYKNGVAEPGIVISRKVGTASDVGAFGVIGEFTAAPDDYVEVYVEVDVSSTVTFYNTSIIITEKN